MNISARIRRFLKIFLIAAVMMMMPLPLQNVIPSVTEVHAAAYGLNQTSVWMNAGKTRKLKVRGAEGTIKWSSSNRKIAKVSRDGVVTALKAGKAKITASCPALSRTASCTVRVFTQASVKKKLLKLQKKYPEGKYWTNESAYYFWEAAYMHTYGCYALVGLFSDHVFGKNAPIKMHTSFSKIKAGDHIRIGNYHSVVVLEKKGNRVTVVEGNYNSSVHWKRVLTKSELQSEGFFVETRYW